MGGEVFGGAFSLELGGACVGSSTSAFSFAVIVCSFGVSEVWATLTPGLVAALICGRLVLPFSPVPSTGDRSELFTGRAKPAQTFSPTRSSSPSATLALSSLSSSRRFSSVASSSGSGRADCHCISANARTTIASRQRGYPESV